MDRKRTFISFDFDHDEDLRNLLVGQAKNSNSPFEIADWSVKEPISSNWREKVRSRIRRTDLTIVICGEYTHTAAGVAAEVTIARAEGKPYFLLKGRNGKTCRETYHCPRERRNSRMDVGESEEADRGRKSS